MNLIREQLPVSADARVRLWERIHGIRLPRSDRHPVLRVVARATGLTLLEVQAVQLERL